ncbi:MAG: hypothetical protein EA382_02065, partial [Spirochaetaceae bacterium]
MVDRRVLVRSVGVAVLIVTALFVLLGCESPIASTSPLNANPPAASPVNQAPSVTLDGPTAIVFGGPVELTFTAEDPDDDPLTVEWAFVDTPAGSEATADDLDTDDVGATFVPDALGVFTVKITVSDGTDEASATHAVTVVAEPVDPPGAFALSSPSNNATRVARSGATLSWTAASGATVYDVYIGVGSIPDSPTATVAGTSHTLGTLSYNTTYQWRIVARNEGGSSTSSTWSFTTERAAPTVSNPNPANGSTDIPIETMITWSATNADEYDVYMRFGRMDKFALVQSGLKSPGYAASLEGGQTYQWYVVARNAEKSTTGPTWEFTTQSVDLWNGLAAFWQFNASLTDVSGNGHNGTPFGSVAYAADRFDQDRSAVSLGGGSFIEINLEKLAQSPLNNHKEGFAASFWIRDMGSNDPGFALSKGENKTSGYAVTFDSKGGLRVSRHLETVAGIERDHLHRDWNHVLISWDFADERIRIWANGVMRLETTAQPFINNGSNLLIGSESSQAREGWLNAHLDDMRIYTRPLN